MTCTQPQSACTGKKIPEMPAKTSTGSIPHVPTFWVLGTSAPMTIPIGIVASNPRGITHETVSQPDGSAIGRRRGGSSGPG